MDYLETVRSESQRFLDLARGLDLTAPVPGCEGWTGADLVYHLAEVQESWAQIANGADHTTVEPLERPEDPELVGAFETASNRLVEALTGKDPAAECWSWHDEGHSIGWVLRRQAHEVIIHRVDAERTAGEPVTPVPADLAADGVDEILTVMVDGVPHWGTFDADGTVVRLEAVDAPGLADWTMRLGRFRGTSRSGKDYDLPAAMIVRDGEDVPDDVAVVRAPAWELDLWLWGRGELPDGAVAAGDAEAVEQLRATVADATQ